MAGSQRAVLAARCVGALLDLQSYVTPDDWHVGGRIIPSKLWFCALHDVPMPVDARAARVRWRLARMAAVKL